MRTGRARWRVWELAMGAVVGALCGIASALFLHLLDRVLALHGRHPWLLFGLPAFGLLSAWLYRTWGREAEGGGPLILDEALEFRGRVRSRMAPLVLAGTLLSHLGGASVGREGTAVQMGASLARTLGKLPWRWLRLTRSRQRLLLMAGVSGGFASLFGTPVAGAVFGVEVLRRGRLHLEGAVICTVAAFVGDGVGRALGVHHGAWAVAAVVPTAGVLLRLALFALPVAAVARTFAEGAHRLAAWTRDHAAWWARPLMGGVLVILLAGVFPDPGYRNLGLPFLPAVFEAGRVASWTFAAKLLFTLTALGFGFKGGEVTPLFVIGALLGAACAPILGLPVPYLGAVGFVALFAASSNTPLASTLMGVELFGWAFAVPMACTGFLAFALAGHPGIYRRG